MKRWAFLIPRLIILGLLFLLVWVGADSIAKFLIVEGLQSTIGSQVDVAQVKYDFSNQKVYLKELTISDPADPMTNLIQADMAYFSLDAEALFNRQIVIEKGQASRVVFKSPRTVPAEKIYSRSAVDAPEWDPTPSIDRDQLAQQWLDHLSPLPDHSPQSIQFEITQRQDPANRFAKDIQQILLDIQNLQTTRKKVSESIRNPKPRNPLRQAPVTQSNPYVAIRLQANQLTEKLVALEQRLAEDDRQLTLSHQRDQFQITKLKTNYNFDGDHLTKLLLDPMYDQFVTEILEIYKSIQGSLPNRDTFIHAPIRGTEILPVGVKRRPSIVIKSLDLEGNGFFAGRQVDFAGKAFNLSTEPELHSDPVAFDVRAQGKYHLAVSGVIDRRADSQIDELAIHCPEIRLATQAWGTANSIQVTMSPNSRLQAEINLNRDGEQIHGEIVFQHSDVALHVDSVNDLAGGRTIALQMNQGLAELAEFTSTIKISGKLNQHSLSTRSDFGKQLSHNVNSSLNQRNRNDIARWSAQLEKIFVAEKKKLNTVMVQVEELGARISSEKTAIAQLEKQSQGRTSNEFYRLK